MDVQRLAANGRLFVRQDSGELVRASALAAMRAIPQGRLESVSARGDEVTFSDRRTTSEFYDDHHSGFTSVASVRSSDVSRHSVSYVTSPVSSADDLEWLDPAEPGLPGSPTLPHSGAGTVVTSESEARAWKDRTLSTYAGEAPFDWLVAGSDAHSLKWKS